jgi:glycerol-3-phosphate acyltransferase PlsY
MSGPVDGFSLQLLAAVAAGYLVGSIPFGLVLTRLSGEGDIRDIGSGNIGATNVLRTGKIGLALLTLVLDTAKGTLVVWLVTRNWGFVLNLDAGLLAGMAAVLGHVFPVWLKFHGGKGVATTLGVLAASYWPVGVGACAIWLLAAGTFRTSSLAALTALAGAPLIAVWLGAYPVAMAAGGLAVLSVYRHRANIERLMKGEEPKIGGGGTSA